MQNVDKWMQVKKQSMLLCDELYTIQEVPEIERIWEKQMKTPSEFRFSSTQGSSALSVTTRNGRNVNPLCLVRSENCLTSPNLNYWKMKLEMMNAKKNYINRWMAETSEKIYQAIEKVKVATEKMHENVETPQEEISTFSSITDDRPSEQTNTYEDLKTVPTILQIDTASTFNVTETTGSVSEMMITESSSSVGIYQTINSTTRIDSFHSVTSDDSNDLSNTEMFTVRATEIITTESEKSERVDNLEDIEEKLKQNRNPLNYLEFDQLPSRPDEAMTSIPENIKHLVMETMKMLGESDLTEMKRLYRVMKRAGKVDQMLIYELGKKAFPQNEKPDGDWKILAPEAYFAFGKALLTVFHATVLLSGGDAPFDDENVNQRNGALNSIDGIVNYWKSSQATSSQRILVRQERKLLQLLSENKPSSAKRYINPAYAHVKSRYMESMKKKFNSKEINPKKSVISPMKIASKGNEKRNVPSPKAVISKNRGGSTAEAIKPQQASAQREETKVGDSVEQNEHKDEQEKENDKFDSSLSLRDFPPSESNDDTIAKACNEKTEADNKRSISAHKSVVAPTWKLSKTFRELVKKSSNYKLRAERSGSDVSMYKQHHVSEADSDEDVPNYHSEDSSELPRKNNFVVFSKNKYVEVRGGDEGDSWAKQEEAATYNLPDDKKPESESIVRKLYRNLPALRPLIVDSLIANLVVAYVINLTGNAFCEPQKPSGFTCTVSHALKGKLRTMLIRALRLVDDF